LVLVETEHYLQQMEDCQDLAKLHVLVAVLVGQLILLQDLLALAAAVVLVQAVNLAAQE
jgi:hypothetical protein